MFLFLDLCKRLLEKGDNLNIYDIAKKAGVSIATVSRVLNNNPGVSDNTSKKVKKVMEELNYIPNGVARSLATNRTNTIGIMVPDIRNNFHFQAAYELEQLLYNNNYSSMLCNTTEKTEQKINYLNLLIEKKVDAIITVGASYGESELIKHFKQVNKQTPIVLLNNYDEELISVYCDELTGIKEALKHLSSKHYKNPIFVSDDREFRTRAFYKKEEGFKQGLKEYFPNNEFIELSIEDSTDGCEKLIEFLKGHSEVDSIQFEKDSIAIKFLSVSTEHGIKIPEEIGIVGFDNIDLTNYTAKKISSVDHRIKEHAEVSVDTLLKKLNGEAFEMNHMITPIFVSKETT